MRVRFQPQAWIRDYAVDCDCEGPDTYDVGEIPPEIQSNTYESDEYKDHPNAPQWVRDWTGPFEVDVEVDR